MSTSPAPDAPATGTIRASFLLPLVILFVLDSALRDFISTPARVVLIVLAATASVMQQDIETIGKPRWVLRLLPHLVWMNGITLFLYLGPARMGWYGYAFGIAIFGWLLVNPILSAKRASAARDTAT